MGVCKPRRNHSVERELLLQAKVGINLWPLSFYQIVISFHSLRASHQQSFSRSLVSVNSIFFIAYILIINIIRDALASSRSSCSSGDACRWQSIDERAMRKRLQCLARWHELYRLTMG
jgi:hypothetical protein